MNSFTLFTVVCTYLLWLSICSSSRVEIDVSWDFDENDKASGWANVTSELSNLESKVVAGELRCSIIGLYPTIDSPPLFLNVTRRHYVIIRAMHLGQFRSANLLLRSGPAPSPREQFVFKKSYWSERQPVSAISDSGSLAGYHGGNAVDNDPYTLFIAQTSGGASITFDLGDNRLITSLRVLSSGDTDSPRRCILQKSITSGVGPFETVTTFALANRTTGYSSYAPIDNQTYAYDNISDSYSMGVIEDQVVQNFQGYARYWRIVFVDNFGGSRIAVREIHFDGYDESVTPVPFNIDNTGVYQNYYVPINTYLSGYLLRMRLELIYQPSSEVQPYKSGKIFRENFHIDYIRVARAPEIWKVRGCLDQYYEDANYMNPMYNVTTVIDKINDFLPLHYYIKNSLDYQYATTYDCPLEGNAIIHVEGINFGNNATVLIGGRICEVFNNTYLDYNGRIQEIICRLPAYVSAFDSLSTGASASAGGDGQSQHRMLVRVQNAIHPGLFHEVPSLQYRVAPPPPERPIVTNIGARRVDLVWAPPGNEFDNMMVTGYKILWFIPNFPSRVSNFTVGNVTTTSVRGLEPATEYVFSIAAMSEGAMEGSAVLPTDLYGRRDQVNNALIGTFSVYTNITATLLFDFDFNFFTANQTLNASSSTSSNGLGPTGQVGSEGAYGLVLVGSANVENCNVSSTCCDTYNATIGVASCGTSRSVCAVLPARMLAYDLVVDGITRRGVPTNLPYSNGAPPEINIITLDELVVNKGADLPSSRCGPALRLTSAAGRQSGATWYRRKMDVREGFDTFIKFQISNPSQKCDRLDDVNTYCRSRGADGLAFVLQNVAPDALGNAGSGLGYEGIFNSLSVELDTFHNYENMDYYENHVAVMTQGFRYNITANHSRSLATSNRVPDLTDGKHVVRIKYDPNFDESALLHPSFQVNGFATWFINNADYGNGGEGDWGTGIGLLYVYMDDMYSPIITTPLNLGATLQLENGRSFVGLTAATGDEYFQTHDILSWQFSSLFIDEKYQPPTVVNNEGDHQCVDVEACVHRTDYNHFMRENHWWGKGSDSTQGWMTGKEGFCAFC